jgi:hypothetical protein
MKKRSVLVFPGGTEIGLEVWRSLRYCKEFSLYSAGADVSNHAPYVFKKNFIVPDVHEPNWVATLSSIVRKHNIDYVFPAHDDVVLALAQNSGKIPAEIVSSPLKTCSVCRSKSETYTLFKDLLPMPRIFGTPSDIDRFPVFVKPDIGQGSQSASKVENLRTLLVLLKNNPALAVFEYLPGKEYTIDCFTDRRKGLLFCSGRERIRVRAGISMSSRLANAKTAAIFRKTANTISKELEFHGAWFFQMKANAEGVLELLEVAPRISGTAALARVLGANLALLSIYEKEGRDIEIMLNKCDAQIDRALVNRYRHNLKYSKVYVDLDDTLVIQNKINSHLVQFLYQSLNEGCKVILITKTIHVGGFQAALKQFRLESFFDEIVALPPNASKADFIDPQGSIFIDDSFNERKAVFERLNIPTFDCSMIELLINEAV